MGQSLRYVLVAVVSAAVALAASHQIGRAHV